MDILVQVFNVKVLNVEVDFEQFKDDLKRGRCNDIDLVSSFILASVIFMPFHTGNGNAVETQHAQQAERNQIPGL